MRVSSSPLAWVKNILPLGFVILSVLLALMPWPVVWLTALCGALPLALVFYFTVQRPQQVPYLAVALIGLIQDLLSGSLAGTSALSFLTAQGLVLWQRRFLLSRPFFWSWLWLALVAASSAGIEWVVGIILSPDGAAPSGTGALLRAALTVALYPLVTVLLLRFYRSVP